MSKPESVCMWCDDQWPMSRHADEAGEHTIQADGVYGTVPCRRPEEYAKFKARVEREKLASELWHQACDRWPGGGVIRDAYYRELLIAAGLMVERKPGDPKTLPCGWKIGGNK